MVLTTEELDVLMSIDEGMNDFNKANINTGIDIPKLKQIFSRLEREGYITIQKSFDNEYGEEKWVAKITDKGKHYIDKSSDIEF